MKIIRYSSVREKMCSLRHTLRDFGRMLCEFCPPADENSTLKKNDQDQESVCASMEEARALWFAKFRMLEKPFDFVVLFASEPHRRSFFPAMLLIVGIHCHAEAAEPQCSLSHSTATRAKSLSLLVASQDLVASS